MKFNDETLKLGTRFYQVVSDEEYFTYSLVYIDEKHNKVILMNEETMETEEVEKKTLEDDYVMLINYYEFTIINYRPKSDLITTYKNRQAYSTSIWYEKSILKLYDMSEINHIYDPACMLCLNIYPFITKAVFYEMLNYIVQFNYSKYRLIKNKHIDDRQIVYNMYMEQMCLHYDILDICDEDYGTIYKYEDKDKYLLNDNIIEKAENMLDKPILSYDCYLWTEQINLNNVSMRHFWLYMDDKYYFVLYLLDSSRSSAMINKNIQDHITVVEFMLK